MSQVWDVPLETNQTFSSSNPDINNAFDALKTTFIGGSDPTASFADGLIWINTTGTPKLKGRASSASFDIGDWGVSNLGHLRKDGTIPLTADWDVGAFKIKNLATPTVSADAVTKAYADLKLALAGGTLTGTLISNLGAAGDPIHQFVIPSGATWTIGIDDSISDIFRIQPASTLGGDAGLYIDTAGNVAIGTSSVSGLGKLMVYDASSSVTINCYAGAQNINANINATASSSGGTGDARFGMAAGGADYAIGIDNSDSDRFKISAGVLLGNSDIFMHDWVINEGKLYPRWYFACKNSAPTDANLDNSQLSWWINESTNNLTIRIRKSDGTYRTATISTT